MKTKPHTIRFEKTDFDFICKRQGLKTAQAILNFLMSEYMKIYKVEKPSIFASKQPEYFDSKKMVDDFTDEPKQWQESKIKIKRSFENYMQLRKDCTDEDEWLKLKEEILNVDHLSQKQKSLLTN